ncbi:MAG TPA: TonB-dependent receptor [Flavipsychrobacter sp.]|nr:TonB-dependent receptor [Flavipsychrobacter sp.]
MLHVDTVILCPQWELTILFVTCRFYSLTTANMKYPFFWFLLLSTYCGFSQNITISGFIVDSLSDEKLIGAVIAVPSLNIGTSTNAYGFYSITVPANENIIMQISYVGFRSQIRSVNLHKNENINFSLVSSGTLREVSVASERAGKIHESSQMSVVSIPIAQAKSLPTFLGEVDIMKTIQLLPGIQAANEGSSNLIVRGGSPDQNLILLDGVPVYNAYHLFGIFSVFNADALSSLEVVKGGFPARYGGRLSSVVDIKMKEGNKQKYHTEGGIGLLASRIMVEGPIVKNKMSFMISGRRTYYDILARPLYRSQTDGKYRLVLNFYDLNAKLNYRLSEKDHIYISAYMGNDKFGIKEKSDNEVYNSGIKWGNITAVARWNHLFNSKLFGNFTLYHSRYKFNLYSELSGANENYKLNYFSGIYDWAAKYDVDYIPNNRHYIKAGLGGIYHTYTPNASQIKGANIPDIDSVNKLNSIEGNAYIEDDILITAAWKANVGLHFNSFFTDSKTYISLQPRLSTRYILFERTSLKASYAYMNQYIHLLSNSGIGLPTDLWVPVTDKLLPMQAHQMALGMAHTTRQDVEISVEGYYKKMNNVLEYKNGASFILAGSNWQDKVTQGRGESYGGEFFVHKKAGRTSGMISYTLSWSNRLFSDLNNGKTFPYKYDRRHDFKIALVHKLTSKIELSCDWIFSSGNTMSIPTAKYYGSSPNSFMSVDEPYNYYYPARNNYRMPAYHRLDAGAKFTKVKSKSTREWVLGIYNMYNRRNPFYIYSEEKNGITTFKQISLLGFLPSISYNFKF